MQLSQRPSRPGAQGRAYNEAFHSPARCLGSVAIGGAHREREAEFRWVQIVSCLVADSESPRRRIYFACSPSSQQRKDGLSSLHTSSQPRFRHSLVNPMRPHLNLLIPKLPPSSVSRTPLQSLSPPSPSNAGGAQRSDNKMPQNGVIEIPSDNESDESDELSFGSLWAWNCLHKIKSKSSAGTGIAWNPRRDWTTGC